MRISDWSSDVCSSDLHVALAAEPIGRDIIIVELPGVRRIDAIGNTVIDAGIFRVRPIRRPIAPVEAIGVDQRIGLRIGAADREGAPAIGKLAAGGCRDQIFRSEEHTSDLQSLMRISYAVFCLKKKNIFVLSIFTSSI